MFFLVFRFGVLLFFALSFIESVLAQDTTPPTISITSTDILPIKLGKKIVLESSQSPEADFSF